MKTAASTFPFIIGQSSQRGAKKIGFSESTVKGTLTPPG